jgi:hypothetical protein
MLNQKTSEGQFYDFGKLAKSPFIRLKVGKIAIFFVLKLAKSPFFRLKIGKIANIYLFNIGPSDTFRTIRPEDLYSRLMLGQICRTANLKSFSLR